jgi:hypothetical protein
MDDSSWSTSFEGLLADIEEVFCWSFVGTVQPARVNPGVALPEMPIA